MFLSFCFYISIYKSIYGIHTCLFNLLENTKSFRKVFNVNDINIVLYQSPFIVIIIASKIQLQLQNNYNFKIITKNDGRTGNKSTESLSKHSKLILREIIYKTLILIATFFDTI